MARKGGSSVRDVLRNIRKDAVGATREEEQAPSLLIRIGLGKAEDEDEDDEEEAGL